MREKNDREGRDGEVVKKKMGLICPTPVKRRARPKRVKHNTFDYSGRGVHKNLRRSLH